MSGSSHPITTYYAGAKELNTFFMIVIATGGFVNLLVVLIYWFNPNIRRPASFVNFFASFILWAASYDLLSVSVDSSEVYYSFYLNL